MINKIRFYTSKIEPYWTLLGAPISQELIFRFIPFQFFGSYWGVGIITSVVYSLIHWYFGLLTTIATLILGRIVWYLMVHFGLYAAVLAHFMVNLMILTFWRDKWFDK